ncbi:MAG: Gfo/Idh/MocA family oxidoreductase [Anaerolineae bacterium]|nr:Gfo/Idh/MocA family oxidoreductase [Anaerolineae bacterium]
MPHNLKALVLGSGFAGKGHALALRDCGVEVVGMISRTESVVKAVAAELDIPHAGTDWQAALEAFQPDIVAIGTPGGVHVAPILAALGAGCHVFCDKPLAPTAAEAKTLYDAAQAAGVKTAYAASYCYEPHALLAQELVAAGEIGAPQEVECVSHYNLNPLIPFGWSHRLDQGGGRLNNNFTHKLAIVLRVLSGQPSAATGETRNDMKRAPVVSGVHDFRERENFAPDADAQGIEWQTVDSDWTYTVLVQAQSPFNRSDPVSALFKHSGLQPRHHPDYMLFYGSEGAIYIQEAYAQGPLSIQRRGGEWHEVPVPAHISEALPAIEDHTQRNWTQLMREFVADIRGESAPAYQTFKDGWIAQEIIDAVRDQRWWRMG